MNYRKLLYGGLGMFLVSLFIGIGGTVWGIYRSFDALKMNESAGIGAVGGGIYAALIFTVVSLVGCFVGVGLTIYAAVKLRKK